MDATRPGRAGKPARPQQSRRRLARPVPVFQPLPPPQRPRSAQRQAQAKSQHVQRGARAAALRAEVMTNSRRITNRPWRFSRRPKATSSVMYSDSSNPPAARNARRVQKRKQPGANPNATRIGGSRRSSTTA